MSESTPQAKGPAPVQLTPQTTEPALIPADQVKPEDAGTLAIEYREGKPVIVVSGGKYIPAGLTVVDGAGNAVAAYNAGPAQKGIYTYAYDFYNQGRLDDAEVFFR
ncbi:tetratricopeptide repeat protein [Kitasatospora sp. NPDC001175]|uniref:tetratricopeptide repeat protein n=1 Tax=Kitasatospora sp. NPDC001175 TaxID=3157103 RepID=UPI003D0467C1